MILEKMVVLVPQEDKVKKVKMEKQGRRGRQGAKENRVE